MHYCREHGRQTWCKVRWHRDLHIKRVLGISDSQSVSARQTELWDNALSMHGCRNNVIHMIETASSVAGPFPSLLGLSVVCAESDNVDTAQIGGRVMTQKAQDNLNSMFPLSLLSYLYSI